MSTEESPSGARSREPAAEAADADAARSERVFLDAGGHAPILAAARRAFDEAVDRGWADPRRLHTEGRTARLLLEGARESLAGALSARTEEIDLLPSHTLALHAAVRSVARADDAPDGTWSPARSSAPRSCPPPTSPSRSRGTVAPVPAW
ncbi:hypothetical protein [Cellulomonas sp. WB94]|uniref:hypothetical protein n=1 Tax=Cellulomonas sp. WB94 TaxID=2173174 RepID=UPI001F5B34FF|nr:hypothetical protein [Cellulomonas sp. WB94]